MQNFCPFSPLRRVVFLSLSYLSIFFSLEAWVCLHSGGCRHFGNAAGWLQRKTDPLGKTETLTGVRLLVLVLLLVLFSVNAASAYSNIPSGDFDTTVNWTKSITGSGTSGSVTYYTSGSYDNSSYARLYAKGSYASGDLDRNYYTYTRLTQVVNTTGRDKLYFYAKYTEHDDTYSYAIGRVYVGTRVINLPVSGTWTLYSLDISALEGDQTLKIEAYAKGDYGWSDYATAYLYIDHLYFDDDTEPVIIIPQSDSTIASNWCAWLFSNVISPILTNGLFAVCVGFLLLAGMCNEFVKKRNKGGKS
ncbi:hypothetical protein MSSAC_2391 [Methanosarcina siciliae C2J]|uniref:Uncharacterized protein n=1 Tax=Methanosarcina siciliae C2J TaxID=1434118 RepID=A0A0E3LDB5_9EURY|nr:hypothetical protein [Methanosarcina siciliae]AKB36981.1 hypothetical protein MSSAC_2391 [Methanosarcina siciliae C2J]